MNKSRLERKIKQHNKFPASREKTLLKCSRDSFYLWRELCRCVRWLVKETHPEPCPWCSCIKHRAKLSTSLQFGDTHRITLAYLPSSTAVSGRVPDRRDLQWPRSKHWARIARALGRCIFMGCAYFPSPQRRSGNIVFPRWAKQTTSKEFKCTSCKFSSHCHMLVQRLPSDC